LVSVLLGVVILPIGGCFLLPNQPPLPAVHAEPLTGEAPLQVSFDATASTDSDGIVIAYRWSFGDGTDGHGQTIDHTFNVPGTYAARLAVEDDDGAEVSLWVDVVVDPPNVPPSAAFVFAPSWAFPEAPVQFDASASSDADGVIVAYAWDLGDGAVGAGPMVEHAFPEPGLYSVTLTVTDDDGATRQRTLAVFVSPTPDQAPQARFVPTAASIEVGEIVWLDASSSSVAVGAIERYEWSFGDGSAAAGVTVGHSYSVAGSYTVTLAVVDTLGGSAQATGTVYVGGGAMLPPSPPPAVGETISRSFSWYFEGRARPLSILVPRELYEWSVAQPRNVWPYRDYDEYVLNPLDDALMRTISQSLEFDCYFRTIKNALAFVQAGIGYQLDPTTFEYPRYPVETLVDGVGDCEDTAILYASLSRTLGHGALLAAVDTNQDGVSDHMVVFVPVGDSYADYGIPEAWEYRGMMYAFAETATEGGYTPLGVDPWGLELNDIQQVWDVSRVDSSPKMVKHVNTP